MKLSKKRPGQSGQLKNSGNVRNHTLAKLRLFVIKAAKNRLVAVTALLLLLGTASFAAYYNSSNRVFSDAFTKLLTADSGEFDGTISIVQRNNDETIKIVSSFEGSTTENEFNVSTENKFSIGALDINLDMDIAADQRSMYFKLDNAKEVADLAETIAQDDPNIEIYKQLADQLDGTWIKANTTNGQLGDSMAQCDTTEIAAIFDKEHGTIKRIFDQNQFIKAERETYGLTEQQYNLSIDENEGGGFAQEIAKTELVKKLQKDCIFDLNEGETSESEPEVEQFDGRVSAKVWINPWTRELKRFELKVSDIDLALSLVMNFRAGEASTMIPSDAVPFEQIFQEDLQEQFQEQFIEPEQPEESQAEQSGQQLELQSQLDPSAREVDHNVLIEVQPYEPSEEIIVN